MKQIRIINDNVKNCEGKMIIVLYKTCMYDHVCMYTINIFDLKRVFEIKYIFFAWYIQ